MPVRADRPHPAPAPRLPGLAAAALTAVLTTSALVGGAAPAAADPGRSGEAPGRSDEAPGRSEKAPPQKAPSEKGPSEKGPSGKAPSEKGPSGKGPSGKAPSTKAPSGKAPSEKGRSGEAPGRSDGDAGGSGEQAGGAASPSGAPAAGPSTLAAPAPSAPLARTATSSPVVPEPPAPEDLGGAVLGTVRVNPTEDEPDSPAQGAEAWELGPGAQRDAAEPTASTVDDMPLWWWRGEEPGSVSAGLAPAPAEAAPRVGGGPAGPGLLLLAGGLVAALVGAALRRPTRARALR